MQGQCYASNPNQNYILGSNKLRVIILTQISDFEVKTFEEKVLGKE
jgi:hypothetical protein